MQRCIVDRTSRDVTVVESQPQTLSGNVSRCADLWGVFYRSVYS